MMILHDDFSNLYIILLIYIKNY